MANNIRYFQHLNPQDSNFQKVTELVEIDNTDPEFILYYFKDGTKCNEDFIGKLNETDVYGRYEIAEVSSPTNIWQFEITEIKREVKYAVNAQGQRVEVADILDRSDHQIKEGKRISIKKAPKQVEIKNTGSSIDFNISNKKDTIENTVNNQNEISKSARSIQSNTIDGDNNKNCIISFTNGDKKYNVSIEQLIESYVKEPEVIEVEKIIEKKVEVNTSNDLIEISLDDAKKNLIENMIDMSQKDTCTIDMEVTLNLPPVSVYQLFNTVYPKGMADAFVNIIANRMDTKDLKYNVAKGLLSYYDANIDVSISNEQL